jgi:putative ABC transport system ATP-binding protein
MIKLQQVVKEYPIDGSSFFALRDVNLEIKDGEFTAIVGPSGSGKSTLMHIIGLLDQPTSGQVIINKQDTASLTDSELSKLRNSFVGFVFQQFNLINKMSVLENVLLPTIYTRKRPNFNPKQKALALLDRFGISAKVNTFPNKLSGGQQQRVAIARALIMNPQLILADEPTGNLDTNTGNTILDLLEQLNQDDHVSVVLVTHEEDVARRAGREIKIRDGRVVED